LFITTCIEKHYTRPLKPKQTLEIHVTLLRNCQKAKLLHSIVTSLTMFTQSHPRNTDLANIEVTRILSFIRILSWNFG